VKRDAATRAANDWLEATEAEELPTGLYGALGRGLTELLSDDAAAGIGYIDDSPVVVALDGHRFICITVRAADTEEGQAAVEAFSYPLNAPLRLDVHSRLEQHRRSTFRARLWTLSGSGLQPLSVSTRRAPANSPESDPRGEAVLSEVARTLGWPLPSD
jgi:hypothetical protein